MLHKTSQSQISLIAERKVGSVRTKNKEKLMEIIKAYTSVIAWKISKNGSQSISQMEVRPSSAVVTDGVLPMTSLFSLLTVMVA